MMDLEKVLPAGVQVTSIEPVITAEGDVNIRLRVSGPRELQVELVRNLERSQRFLVAASGRMRRRRRNNRARLMSVGTGVPGGVEFEIVSGYNPLSAAAVNKPVQRANESKPGLGQKTAAAHKVAAAGTTNKPAVPGKAKKPVVNGGAR